MSDAPEPIQPINRKTQVRFRGEPATLVIDGRFIRFDVTRFDVKAGMKFRAAWAAAHDRPSQTFTSRRNPGEEMAKRSIARPRTKDEIAAAVVLAELRADASWPDSPAKTKKLDILEVLLPPIPHGEVFIIPPAEIRARRLAEMSSDERARQKRLEDEETDRMAEFILDTITACVTARPGQLYDNGREVTAGADLALMFAGRPDVLDNLKSLPLNENFLLAESDPKPDGDAKVQTSTEGSEKNESRSPSATAGSSDSDRQGNLPPVGNEPAPTAASAEEKESAVPAPATA